MPELDRTGSFPGAIFLSYASQDSMAAKAIFETLSAAGFEVWFDQSELRGGDAWDQKIRRQIKECALFVPIISAHTQTRAEGYFRLEWHLAEQRTYLMAHDQSFLLPVVVDDTPDSAARVPERFRERQWTRLRDGVVPTGFAERVHKLLSGAAPAPVRAAPTANPYSRPAAAPRLVERSVAVLPFANMSDDKENEYFSDGVSEELLTVLQRIPGLRVAARTSAFSFKGKTATTQEIGLKLGVAHLVEGSVQKAGSRVKVTARLSRVSTGEQHWSRSYTREVKDVFELQEELAMAILDELRGHLEGGDSAAAAQVREASKGGTTNAEAYQQFLMARHFGSQFSSESTARALAHITRATELDPHFATAWAHLGRIHCWFCGYDGTLTRDQFDDHLAKARLAVDRALALEPDLPAGLEALFWIEGGYDGDWTKAEATGKRALELAPSDSGVLLMNSRLAATFGETERAVELARRAVDLDPISASSRVQLALSLMGAGRFEEAKVEARRTAELNPNSMFAKSGLGYVHIYEGKFAEAEKSVAGAEDTWSVLWVRALACFGQGKKAESDRALEEMIAKSSDTAAIQIAATYAFRTEIDDAFAWVERARNQRDPGIAIMLISPIVDNMRDDPRWPGLCQSFGLPASRPV